MPGHGGIQYWDLINKYEDLMGKLDNWRKWLNEQAEEDITGPKWSMEETKIIRTDHRGFGYERPMRES